MNTSTTAAPSRVGFPRIRRTAQVWLTVLTLLALVVPITAAGATTETAEVKVHFTPAGTECDVVEPHARTVASPAVLTGALTELLEGPTAEERPATATMFSDATAGLLRSVAIRDGVAYVDFADLRQVIPNASSACGSASLLSQLDATTEQFPTVLRSRYSIDGSQVTFYNWLQRDVPGESTVNTTLGSLRNTAAIQRTTGAEATLRKVRVGRHDGFDRIVFEFEDGRPSYTVRYTGVATTGGAGAPIPAGGTTALQIDMGAHTVDMEAADVPRTFDNAVLTPRYPTLRTVRYGGEFEGLATFAAGLRARTGFRVLELSNPARLAIDVAHGAIVRRLDRGDRGSDVADWQLQLNTVQHGPFASSTTPTFGLIATDGIFGPNTDRATRLFQRAEGVAATGDVDGATRGAMRRALTRAAAIRA
ncbi:MAG TPA: peptidoglycan-binding protein [Euzebyales bacterium]|nr:peptidoglycan-binding protein [Euzebyales bacterium]